MIMKMRMKMTKKTKEDKMILPHKHLILKFLMNSLMLKLKHQLRLQLRLPMNILHMIMTMKKLLILWLTKEDLISLQINLWTKKLLRNFQMEFWTIRKNFWWKFYLAFQKKIFKGF